MHQGTACFIWCLGDQTDFSCVPDAERFAVVAGLLFRAGIISDIQYADIPDGKSFGGIPRYYRSALQGLKRYLALCCQLHVSLQLHVLPYH